MVFPGVGVDVMLQADPCDKGSTEDEVKEPFVGDGEDDEDWRESQK